MSKSRLDLMLVQRELVESRELARRIIGAGQVLVNGQLESKASKTVHDDADIQIKELPRYVSRGGEKLETAFKRFSISVTGKDCVDIGASTGGFTDCLLQNGAGRVVCVDVGKGLLHWKLRNDPRVVVIEEYNARNLEPAVLPWLPAFGCVDVSFISLRKVVPAVISCMQEKWELILLIKPQFEAGRENVAKGGVVKDESVRKHVLDDFTAWCQNEGRIEWIESCDSGVRGPAGNMEILAHIKAKQ